MLLSVHNYLVILTKFIYLLQKFGSLNIVSFCTTLIFKTFSIIIDYFVEITKRKFIF